MSRNSYQLHVIAIIKTFEFGSHFFVIRPLKELLSISWSTIAEYQESFEPMGSKKKLRSYSRLIKLQ